MTGRKTCLGRPCGSFLYSGQCYIYLIITLLTFVFEMIKYDGEKSCRPDACGMYCNVMERKVMKKTTGKRENGGFSLVELIIVIAIMAVLVGVLAPQYLAYIHKAKVAADQANLKNYFTEIQMDYITTGKYNSMVPTEHNSREDYMQREISKRSDREIKSRIFCCDSRYQESGRLQYMLSL